MTVSFSDVAGGQAGAFIDAGTLTWASGNVDADPLFADAASNNYHPKSQAGRFNPATGAWVTDAVTSPCIDAGDPASPYAAEPHPHGYRINMGAFGNLEVASKNIRWPIPGDANGDCRVNILDLIAIRGRLNQSTTTGDNWIADVTGDGRINILDLILVRTKLNTKCE